MGELTSPCVPHYNTSDRFIPVSHFRPSRRVFVYWYVCLLAGMHRSTQYRPPTSNCKAGHQESWVVGTSSAVIFVGAVIGQLSMGYLGDVLGRSEVSIHEKVI
jgi:hypothetical protein